jgi:RNA-directed DNA polymerase
MPTLRSLSIRQLALAVGLDPEGLIGLAARAERLYTEKRRTRRGKVRRLRIPSDELMAVQRAIHKKVLVPLVTPPRAHPCAACCPTRGTMWAAERHAGYPVLYQVDLRDFYPSATATMVRAALVRNGAQADVADLLIRLTTIANQLPQGAPTSPALGELVLYPLDQRLASLADQNRVAYTRYADNMLFSGGEHLNRSLHRLINAIIEDEQWTINQEKSTVAAWRERRSALGFVLNKSANIERNYYEQVKRSLRYAIKHTRQIDDQLMHTLLGRIERISAADPHRREVLHTLLETYRNVIDRKQEEAGPQLLPGRVEHDSA